MTNPFCADRRIAMVCGGLALSMLLGACATTPGDSSRLPAVFCVNAPGAGPAPSSVPSAYCTNIEAAAATKPQAKAPAAIPDADQSPSGKPTANVSGTKAQVGDTAGSEATAGAAAVTAAAAKTAPTTNVNAKAAASYRPPTGELTLASNVDVDRYMGRWYVIANIPYAFENGDVGSYVNYKKDGSTINVLYQAHRPDFDHPLHERKGQAYVVKNTHNAKWRVSYVWPIYTSYSILYVDPDYQYALVGYPGRSLGWVYSRTPEVSDAKLKSLLAHFAADGYDVSQFRRVPQTPEQLQR